MPGFKTHFPWGLGGGMIVALAGLHVQQLKSIEALSVIVLGGIGGGLPDLDIKSSTPFKYLTVFFSMVIPFLLLIYLQPKLDNALGVNLFIFAVASYLINRFIFPLVTTLVVKIKHRRVTHTIPFAVLCGELTYLFFTSDFKLLESASERFPLYAGLGVFAGFLLHLVLDDDRYKWLRNDDSQNGKNKKKQSKKKKRSTRPTLVWYSELDSKAANITVYFFVLIAAFFVGTHFLSS